MKILFALVALFLPALIVAPAHAEPGPSGLIGKAQSPEDLLRLPGTPWVVVSAMRSKGSPGRLFLVDSRNPVGFEPFYPATTAVAGGPAATTFAPHGLSVRALGPGRQELLVIDHDGDQVDRFVLRVNAEARPSIERVTRVPLPPACSGNSVAAMPDGGFVATCMSDPRDTAFVDEFARAEPTGAPFRWTVANGWTQLGKQRMSAANGIEVSKDGKNVFVTEWAARRLWRIPLDSGEPVSVPTPFLGDNLRWTDAGRLLVVGQTADPRSLFSCQAKKVPCPMGYVVALVDPKTLALKTLLTGTDASYPAAHFGSGTGAIEVGESLWIATFFGNEIARYPMPKH
jgi:hypothetical protein